MPRAAAARTGDLARRVATCRVRLQAVAPTLDPHTTSQAADAFVIATRGEGWGMPISEAMAMGLPVVVTNWSGVTAFVDETTGYMVDYDLTEVGLGLGLGQIELPMEGGQ